MSHSRKHLTRDALNSFPVPTEAEKIVKVTELRGANICCVLYPGGESELAQIPKRFSKLIWIKRGSYVIVKRPPNVTNYKVRALVEHVLFPDQVKHIKSINLWPAEFADEEETARAEAKNEQAKNDEARLAARKAREDSEESDSDNDDDLFVNPNHAALAESSSDDETDSEDGDEDAKDRHPSGSGTDSDD